MIRVSHLFLAGLLLCAAWAAPGRAKTEAAAVPEAAIAGAQGDIEFVRVGDLAVLSILDAPVTMESRLLPDPDKYPDLREAFAAGAVPAVDRTWFFTTGGRSVLVDSGWGRGQAVTGKTLETLEARGVKPEAVTDILLTHMDFDHIGGLVRDGKAVFPNATLWVSRPEYMAWTAGNVQGRGAAAVALAQAAADAYKGRIRLFEFDEELLPGITARDASGHTPGHTAFDIVSNGEKLAIVGDLVHIAPVQLRHPDVNTVYDMAPAEAAAAREGTLARLAREKAVAGGMHMPAIGLVEALPDGGYAVTEIEGR